MSRCCFLNSCQTSPSSPRKRPHVECTNRCSTPSLGPLAQTYINIFQKTPNHFCCGPSQVMHKLKTSPTVAVAAGKYIHKYKCNVFNLHKTSSVKLTHQYLLHIKSSCHVNIANFEHHMTANLCGWRCHSNTSQDRLSYLKACVTCDMWQILSFPNKLIFCRLRNC